MKQELKPAPPMTLNERWEHWRKHHPKEYLDAISISTSMKKRAKQALREEKYRNKKISTIRKMLEGGFSMQQIATSLGISRQALDVYYKKYCEEINKGLI